MREKLRVCYLPKLVVVRVIIGDLRPKDLFNADVLSKHEGWASRGHGCLR